MATLDGYAFYAKVQSPGTKFQKDDSKDPTDYEYSLDLLVDAQVQRAFYKKYKDQKGKSAEPMTVEEFQQKYKTDPSGLDVKPNSDGEYCIIKLKTGNAYKDHKTGKTEMMSKPKVFFKGDDGKLKEDTETLVGNGSKVKVQFSEFESKKWKTTTAKLKALAVLELVPYGGGDDFSELGEIDSDSFANETPDQQFGSDDSFDADDDDSENDFGFD